MADVAENVGPPRKRTPLLVLAVGLLMAGGVVVMGFGGARVWKAEASRGWPEASGVMLESRVVEESAERHVAVVLYEYDVGGMLHQGHRIRHGDDWWTRPTCDAREDVARYPAGRRVEVRYDPAFPGDSVLEPGSGAGDWAFVAAGAVPFAVGALWLAAPSRRTGTWGAGWSDSGDGDGGDCGGDGGDGD